MSSSEIFISFKKFSSTDHADMLSDIDGKKELSTHFYVVNNNKGFKLLCSYQNHNLEIRDVKKITDFKKEVNEPSNDSRVILMGKGVNCLEPTIGASIKRFLYTTQSH